MRDVMMSVAAAGDRDERRNCLHAVRSGGDINIRAPCSTSGRYAVHRRGSSPAAGPSAYGQYWIDSALSFGIGALILWSSFGILRETMNILLEGTPRGLKLDALEAAIRRVEGVNDVHDRSRLEHRLAEPRAFLAISPLPTSRPRSSERIPARRERSPSITIFGWITQQFNSNTWNAKWRTAASFRSVNQNLTIITDYFRVAAPYTPVTPNSPSVAISPYFLLTS
jgi:hypothetical protein